MTTYKITPGASNDADGDGFSNFNSFNAASGLYDVIETKKILTLVLPLV